MKKQRQWILLCLLIFALLLSACAGQRAGAGTDTPESDAASVPSSSAAAEPALPAPALSGPDVPGEDAAEPEPFGQETTMHTLTEEEKAALWQQLDGMWRMEHPENYEWELLYSFDRGENGEFILDEGVMWSEGRPEYINEMTEQDGVYQLSVYQEWGMMYCDEYEPDACGVVTLALREDGTIEISSRAPARYGQEFLYASGEGEMDEIWGTHWRCATAEEEQLLAGSENGYLKLENGDTLTQSYDSQPVQYHRETPEEAQMRGF